MPSRIEICKDKDEALRMGELGLLMFRVSQDRWAAYTYGSCSWAEPIFHVSYAYWPPSCFGYLVEDE